MFPRRWARSPLTPRTRGALTAAFVSLTLAAPVARAQAPMPAWMAVSQPMATRTETYVLLTGVIGGVTGYQRIERRLASLGYRVVAIDPYRMSIDSENVSYDALARRVLAELDARGITGELRVVGHAHGGGVALRLAALAPRRVTELFLLNVGALAGNTSGVFASSIRLAPLLTRLPGGRRFLRGRILDGIRANTGQHDWLDDASARAYADPLIDDIGRVVTMALRLNESTEPEPLPVLIGRIRIPVTILIGALTCPASPGTEELTALAPLGSLVRTYRLAGVCHFPHEESPEAVVQYLVQPREHSNR